LDIVTQEKKKTSFFVKSQIEQAFGCDLCWNGESAFYFCGVSVSCSGHYFVSIAQVEKKKRCFFFGLKICFQEKRISF
jgi:hypothetical protein